MSTFNTYKKSQSGNAVVIVLVVLAVVAVGALAYLSGNIAQDDKSTAAEQVAAAETAPAAGETETQTAASETKAEVTTEETQTAEVDASTDATTDDATQTAAADAKPPAKIEQGNPVVAKVGDKDVTRLDVLNFIQQLPPNVRQMPLDQLFPLAQDQLINTKVIEMNVKTAEVAKQEAVQKQIEESKTQILQRAYLEKVVAEKTTEKRLKKEYAEAVTKQPDVEEAKASHILVKEESVAKDIIKKLNDGGDFAALAKEFSTDGTAKNGGSLGYFAKADVVPEFAEAAYALKEGTYTKEPVKSQFGYHVIKLDEKRMRPKPSFEDSKPYLENKLSREILEETIEDWKKEAKIERFDINGKPVEEKSN